MPFTGARAKAAQARLKIVCSPGAIWWLRRRQREAGDDVVLHMVVSPDQI